MSDPSIVDPHAETGILSDAGEQAIRAIADVMSGALADGHTSAAAHVNAALDGIDPDTGEPIPSDEPIGTGHQDSSDLPTLSLSSVPLYDPLFVPLRDFQVAGIGFPMGIPIELSTLLVTLRDMMTVDRFVAEGLLIPYVPGEGL